MIITRKHIKLIKRKRSSHKGDYGRILIIGGSKDYVGAVALAGLAALRSGADWVTIAAPEKVAWAVNALSPDLVTIKLNGDYLAKKHFPKIADLAESHDCLLVGNGLGLRSASLVRAIATKISKPMVIDADGIKSIEASNLRNSIITPHKKELEIFMKNSGLAVPEDAGALRRALKAFLARNNVLLLKGPKDLIISSGGIMTNITGNAGMTKAGTGDVLAGLCAGFLASLSPEQAAINAAYFNGLAGDILLKKKGYCFLASDIADDIRKLL